MDKNDINKDGEENETTNREVCTISWIIIKFSIRMNL